MLHKPLLKTGSLLATAFVAGGLAFGQQSRAQKSPPHARTQHYRHMVKKMNDQAFVNKAAKASQAQAKFAKLAEQKGHVQAVKNYGRQMAQQQNEFQQKLKSAASQANINIRQNNEMSQTEQRKYSQLSKLSGPAFDHAYARNVLKAHKDALAAFREEARTGKKKPIKQFAQNQISTLQSQLKKARDLWHDVQPARTHGRTGSSSSTARKPSSKLAK